MIKLILAEEEPKPVPTVRFEFRRHFQASTTKAVEQQAFLTGESEARNIKVYPVKIDGDRQTVEIRRKDFEALGFVVVVKD